MRISAMCFRLLLLPISFFVICFSTLANAEPTIPDSPPPAWRAGYYSATLYSEYFTSNANFNDTRGGFTRLDNSNSFTSFENRVKGRYATSDNVYVFGGTGFTQSHAVDTLTNQDKSNGAFTSVFGGMDYLMARRWMNVVPEIEAGWPVDQTSAAQTVPLTSDNAPYLRVGTFLFKRYSRFRLESYLGLHYPGQDLAKRFMYSLFAEGAVFRSFTVGGGLDGYETVLVDGTAEATRIAYTAQTDAESARFRAWNPALLEGRIWVGFRPDKAFTVRIGYLQTLNGVRAAEGRSILLNISFNSPGSAVNRVNDANLDLPTAATHAPPTSTREEPARLSDPPPVEKKSKASSETFVPDEPPGDNSLDATEKMLEKAH